MTEKIKFDSKESAAELLDGPARHISGVTFDGIVFDDDTLDHKEFLDCAFLGCFFDIRGKELKSDFESCRFIDCKMECVSFQRRNLKKTVFEECELFNSDFRGSDLTRTLFNKCKLESMNMERATLEESGFRNCNMTGSTLRYSVITYSNFTDCDLNDVNVFGTTFLKTQFTRSKIINMLFVEATHIMECVFVDSMPGVAFLDRAMAQADWILSKFPISYVVKIKKALEKREIDGRVLLTESCPTERLCSHNEMACCLLGKLTVLEYGVSSVNNVGELIKKYLHYYTSSTANPIESWIWSLSMDHDGNTEENYDAMAYPVIEVCRNLIENSNFEEEGEVRDEV